MAYGYLVVIEVSQSSSEPKCQTKLACCTSVAKLALLGWPVVKTINLQSLPSINPPLRWATWMLHHEYSIVDNTSATSGPPPVIPGVEIIHCLPQKVNIHCDEGRTQCTCM